MNALRNLIALLGMATSTLAFAQTIQLTVPFPPGVASDVIAKILGPELATVLGKQVIVENRSGSGGALGIQIFSNARADGSQYLFISPSNGSQVPELGNLVPVAAVVGKTTNLQWAGVFAPPGTPANIVRDMERAVLCLIDLAAISAAQK